MIKLIWWLSAADIEAIGEPRETWPSWLREEFVSIRGRAGRRRLWVAREVFGQAAETGLGLDGDAWETPIGKIAERCGGIMVRADDLPLLADLPGLVTDLRPPRACGGCGCVVMPVDRSAKGGTTRRGTEAHGPSDHQNQRHA